MRFGVLICFFLAAILYYFDWKGFAGSFAILGLIFEVAGWVVFTSNPSAGVDTGERKEKK